MTTEYTNYLCVGCGKTIDGNKLHACPSLLTEQRVREIAADTVLAWKPTLQTEEIRRVVRDEIEMCLNEAEAGRMWGIGGSAPAAITKERVWEIARAAAREEIDMKLKEAEAGRMLGIGGSAPAAKSEADELCPPLLTDQRVTERRVWDIVREEIGRTTAPPISSAHVEIGLRAQLSAMTRERDEARATLKVATSQLDMLEVAFGNAHHEVRYGGLRESLAAVFAERAAARKEGKA